ncbi:hypothetical protein F2Q69_00004431 [Brassica cretica]|uniref:Uncharacterized protein n=1 Tax=Brassica cretica TaxID=69181 RepID=A0A8S9P8D1_BRACR|nr:hypothetical protein F2Q69_00004431 [Brassica cretica]
MEASAPVNGGSVHIRTENRTRKLPNFLLSVNMKYAKLGYHYLITNLFKLCLVPLMSVVITYISRLTPDDLLHLWLHLQYNLLAFTCDRSLSSLDFSFLKFLVSSRLDFGYSVLTLLLHWYQSLSILGAGMVETRLQERSLTEQVDEMRSLHTLLAAEVKTQHDSLNSRFDRLEAMMFNTISPLQAIGKAPMDPGPSHPPPPIS